MLEQQQYLAPSVAAIVAVKTHEIDSVVQSWREVATETFERKVCHSEARPPSTIIRTGAYAQHHGKLQLDFHATRRTRCLWPVECSVRDRFAPHFAL